MEVYWARSDLTDREKAVLRYYQDLGNKQHVWSCEIPENVPHPDCYVINNSLRHSEFLETLSEEDVKVCDGLISLLDSAIGKSPIPDDIQLIKGLGNADWIRGKQRGERFTDRGYGSFSTSMSLSMEYAAIQNDGARVFLMRYAQSGTCGVYMGNSEEEILLSRGIQYFIDKIITYEAGDFLPEDKAIVYYLSETY